MAGEQRIAVAGATGRLGRPTVEILSERGHEVVPISRGAGVDVISGEGLAEALEGVDLVIDAATGPSPDEAEATEFFRTAARNLQQAGAERGVAAILVVSIIGVDHFSAGYNAAKRAQERAHLDGPIPARILRAAQFHEFVEQLVEWGTQGEVSYLHEMRTQLVAARSVAEALADLVEEADSAPLGNPVSEVAGPREESLVEAARLLATRRGDGLRIEAGEFFPDPEGLYPAGAVLPGPLAKLAGPTYEEWLTELAG
ncbi:MAG TPA: NAD(P)H-binding protein [Solirubrobacterales bacterium]|nr:NAD(P)H-binding protein [Solirubrobacterales bacterium]